MAETDFRLWRTAMTMSQAAAATALGLSLDQIRNLDTGATRDRPPRPQQPDRRTLLAMAALAAGLEPWHPDN